MKVCSSSSALRDLLKCFTHCLLGKTFCCLKIVTSHCKSCLCMNSFFCSTSCFWHISFTHSVLQSALFLQHGRLCQFSWVFVSQNLSSHLLPERPLIFDVSSQKMYVKLWLLSSINHVFRIFFAVKSYGKEHTKYTAKIVSGRHM